MAESNNSAFDREGTTCLISRTQQWFRSNQFVFIDDGSTNLTYKLLKEVAMIDPRVTIVRPVCAQPPHLIMTFRRHCRNAGAETRFHSSMFLPYIELAES